MFYKTHCVHEVYIFPSELNSNNLNYIIEQKLAHKLHCQQKPGEIVIQTINNEILPDGIVQNDTFAVIFQVRTTCIILSLKPKEIVPAIIKNITEKGLHCFHAVQEIFLPLKYIDKEIEKYKINDIIYVKILGFPPETSIAIASIEK